MRKISANPSHTEHRHTWGGRGRLSDAGSATSISHIPPAIDQSPKSQLHAHAHTHMEERVGETGWQPELEAVALTNGGLIWHRATQSYSRDTNMHIRCVHMCSFTHTRTHMHTLSLSRTRNRKAVPRAHIAKKWSICERVLRLYKQSLDSIFSESCSLNSINLQC